MKNIINKILILIPIGLMLFSGSVKAEEEIIGITKLSPATEFAIEFNHLERKPKKMYNFTINGYLAFCLDPGKGMKNDLEYVMLGDIDSLYSDKEKVKEMKKAWVFYQKYYGSSLKNSAIKLAAQLFIWNADAGKEPFAGQYELAKNVLAIQNDDQNYVPSEREIIDMYVKIAKYYNSVTDADIAKVKLYVWDIKDESSRNSFQRLITNLKGNNTSTPIVPSEKPKCEIVIQNNLTSCNNDISNTGSIYQYAYGTCSAEYTGNKNNIKGEATKSYGSYCELYCLQDLTQTYPGNVATAVNVGRYLVWPNNNINNSSYKANAKLIEYPMSITLTQTCKLYANKEVINEYATKKDSLTTIKNNAQSTYGINVQTEYLNNSCSNLNNDKIQKWNIYQSAISTAQSKKEIFESCKSNTTEKEVKSCTDRITGSYLGESCGTNRNCYCETKKVTVEPACSAEKREFSYAQQAVSLAQTNFGIAYDKWSRCDNYGKVYKQALNIIKEFNYCLDAKVENALEFSVSASSSYDDPTYGGEFNLVESSSTKNCQNCSSTISKLPTTPETINKSDITNKVNEVNNRVESVATITKTFDIEEKNGEYYYYIDKNTNKSVHTLPSSNYSIIGFSNMPISYESKLGKKYDLKLDVDISGTPFDSEIKSQDYTCYYKVNNVPSSCICPEGTKHEGESLDCLIATENEKGQYQYTCSDAQIAWCDSNTEINTYVCPDDSDLTCPNDPSMDLKPCINSGKSYSYCYQKYCVIYNKHYQCPAGTTNEGMNLDACVIPLIEKGYNEQYAYEYCKDISCPYSGIKIIYRTISLTNPFPSYNADKTTSQTGLSIGMFNDTVKGRYPGSNWNGVTTVNTKILNNRQVDGDQVYNKQPLYTFVLDSQTIKAIRNYNNKQKLKGSYSDFTLSCKKGNSACISSFVHDVSYGLSSGTCMNISANGNNFYTCDD